VSPVGLVLSGGGARGAYEIGVLSVLLPEMAARGEQVEIIVGSSIGSLNALGLAARLGRMPPEQACEELRSVWESLRLDQLLSRHWFISGVRTGWHAAGQALGRGPLRSVLDPSPMPGTVARIIPQEDLDHAHAHVESGALRAVAVTGTAPGLARTVVFHDSGLDLEEDIGRGIRYARGRIGHEHLLASSAIPALFPPVEVRTPKGFGGWYVDGGVRLNTPLKPALELGARRLVVIGLTAPWAEGPHDEDGPALEPDVFDSISQAVHAIFADYMAQDLRTLARANQTERETIPYIFVAPEHHSLARLAQEVLEERYGGVRGFLRDSHLTVLRRAMGGTSRLGHAELMTQLLFVPEFAQRLYARGREDALAQGGATWRTGLPEEREKVRFDRSSEPQPALRTLRS
jgi:NTE family protein